MQRQGPRGVQGREGGQRAGLRGVGGGGSRGVMQGAGEKGLRVANQLHKGGWG